MHTISKHWKNPQEFNPDNMNKENLSKMKKTAYIPFGMGRRTCIGKDFGEITVKLLLLNLFKNVEFKSDPEYDGTKLIKLTYGYSNPTVLARIRNQPL